jgi:two-component system NarL family sensor kinase
VAAHGIDTELDVAEDLDVSPEIEQLLFRAAAEAVRNVQRHSDAQSVAVRVSATADRVRLEVSDDGVGFSAAEREQRQAEGHVGLTLLEELANRRGGSLDVSSAPGEGTRFVLEVSLP